MSYSRKSSARQLHLIFSEDAGFQFYYTLPKRFAKHPALPRQLRWSLGRDEPLARQLCAYLDQSLKSLDKVPHTPEPAEIDKLVNMLELLHKTVGSHLKLGKKIWDTLPHPAQLARMSMKKGNERLAQLSENEAVLFRTYQTGELVFMLEPSSKLKSLSRFDWHRLDWPLGTSDEDAAHNAAAYILTAISLLEQLDPQLSINGSWDGAFVLMALYEYLSYARPDKGLGLGYLPSWLPQSLTALNMHISMNTSRNPMRVLDKVSLRQKASGEFILAQEQMRAGRSKKIDFELSLQTTSPILAYLLYMRLGHRFDSILLRHCHSECGSDAYKKAMEEMSEVVRLTTSALPPVKALPQVSTSRQRDLQPKQDALDPAAIALLTALGSILPEEKRQKLEELLADVSGSFSVVSPATPDPDSMTVSQLVDHFESTQLREGAWRNPRTRISVHARLEAMCELLGGHRTINTLTRADIVALRERIRSYPKNRNKLKTLRHAPLAQLMDDPTVESLNPRTTKKFFELIRAVFRHAHDHDLLKTDLAHNLVFKIKGAEAPRKRTYSPGQVEALLKGPSLTLDTAPKWRLDDFKFWLPLLGLYTGCRLAELCQLQLADVRMEEQVWVIHISRTGDRQLKTQESDRLVPLHHALLSMGFLEFVESRRAAVKGPTAQLFDNLTTSSTLATSHVASKWFVGASSTGYLGLCGLGDDHLTFHGLRHTFIQQFRRQKLDMLIVKTLVGHADKTTTGGYGDVYPAAVLKEEIDKVDYGVSLKHIHYKNYLALQKLQGVFRTGRPRRSID
ncbi:site-specific integrase [Halopseudomonas pelagia]|uniref:site-specific integrase n=1 Tax=Halopseudomonas pelagia TaxID=553151 RepID=UPI0003A700E4|nr:site-specific integrase [Halopseudomonas pelagia]